MSNQVALIFGYGPRVGVGVAQALASRHYRVAVVSCSNKHADSAGDYLRIQADLSNPSTVKNIFSRVVDELGHPTVVIYNDFQSENNVNIVSAYVAAQLAIKSFALLPQNSSKTFIRTGNKLPFMVVQPLLSQGVGKAGAAHLIHYLAEEHKAHGYKFYFADERISDGDPVYGDIDGPAHAEFYTQLVEAKAQGTWNATFVKTQGYVGFSETILHDAIVMQPQ